MRLLRPTLIVILLAGVALTAFWAYPRLKAAEYTMIWLFGTVEVVLPDGRHVQTTRAAVLDQAMFLASPPSR